MNTTDKIMALADECAKAFKAADTIHGLHFYMGKQNALRTAVEQALAARVPATGKPYEKGRGNWEFAREGKDCIVVTTPGGGLTRLFRDGGGSMESLAYRMASMLAAAPQPPQQPAEWIDDAGRLQWALWRINELEALLREKNGGRK